MLVQYTAAALVSENKTLCFRRRSIRSANSAGQEDHALGADAARKARGGAREPARIVELRGRAGARVPSAAVPGRGHGRARRCARVPFVTDDRPLGEASRRSGSDVPRRRVLTKGRPHLPAGSLR
jgi:histidine ammonia-lyase